MKNFTAQRGFAHILLLLILLIGLVVGIYLVSQTQIFKSRAGGGPIIFSNPDTGVGFPSNSAGVPFTTFSTVKIEFYTSLGPPVGSGPVSAPVGTGGFGDIRRMLGGSVSSPVTTNTVSYRFAESVAELSTKQFSAYTVMPTVIPRYTFSNPSVGEKFIWVEFKDNTGRTEQRSAQLSVVAGPVSAITDNFNRNNSLASLGTTTSGQVWNALRGRFGIVNGMAYISGDCPAPGYAVVDGRSADGTLKVTLANNIQDAEIPFRFKDVNNGYFLGRSGNGYSVVRLMNGKGVVLTPDKKNADFKNGDQVQIDLAGSNIKVSINGIALFNINDTAITGTNYGIGTWCDTKMRFDDFSFVPVGGTSSPTPAPSPTFSPSPTPAPSPTVEPSLFKKIFVTSTFYDGNLGGVAGADAKCQDRANVARIGGTWKAWISSTAISASNRLSHSTVPYRGMNGSLIANNWTDLTDGSLMSGINITELNTLSYPGVWTATQFNGASTNTVNAYTCVDWTTNYNGGRAAMGYAGDSSASWTNVGEIGCFARMSLYCIEQ